MGYIVCQYKLSIRFLKAPTTWKILKRMRTVPHHEKKLQIININAWETYFEELLKKNTDEFKDSILYLNNKTWKFNSQFQR